LLAKRYRQSILQAGSRQLDHVGESPLFGGKRLDETGQRGA
jgi:hypothetical protein